MAQEPGLEANGDDLVLPQGGRFEILGRLGSGGMGIVYSARDLTTRSRVALKTLRHLDPTALYWFKKEFRSLADLSHPNLVRLDELFCENGQWFFTMEHVEGCDFMRWVREMPTDRRIAYARTLATPVAGVPNPAAYAATQGTPPGRLAQASSAHDDTVATRIAPPSQPAAHPAASASPKQRARASFDESRVRSTLRQIAEGLAVLHAAGKVHRDIKPSNILVRPNGSVVIVDFGLVSEIHSSQQMEDGNIVGTPYYMAPEQALGQTVGPPADWYAVGSILYEVLSGSLPFEGTVTEVLFRKQAADPDPLDALASGIPADLSALCMAMLARDPAARPTAAEVIARLGTSHGARRARTSAPVVTLVPFVGRTTELAQLRNAYAEAVDGKPLTLLVEGESGLGKSALAQQFIVQLDSSALAFSGRCYERESVPYKALDDIVDAISRFLFALDDDEVTQYIPKEIASLARVFPVLRRVRAIERAIEACAISADPHQVRAHAFAAFRELMTLLRARQPVVLLIDDLQWSDPDSLHLLVELMALPDPPPLLLVATLRPGADAIKSRLAGDVRELRLGGLDKAEAIALAKTLLGERDMPRAESIARETRGHPLFIDELARRAATESLRSTLNLDDALWGRIHELDENQRAVVESVAVAGIPVSLSVIAATTKLATGDLTAELAPLRAARLVKTSFSGDRERIEPYHDRVRESVLAHIGQADRVEWHRRLADALDADGAIETAPLALVEHLEAAGEAERAAANAYAAGERAMQVLAFDHAADLFAIALRLGKYEADKTRELQLKVAQAYGHAGRGPEGARQYLAVALDADPERRTEYVSEAAQHLFGSGHLQRGLALLEELTSECGISWPQTSRRALANLLWQRARLRIRGLRWREQDASAVNHRDRVRLKLYWSLSIALAALDPVRSGVYAAQYLRLGLRLGQPTHVAFGLTLEAINVGLASASAARRAHQVLDAARAVKLPAPDRVLDAFIAQANGAICFATGQFDEALPHLEKAEALSEEPRAVWLRTSTRLIRLYCAAHTGRYRWAQIAAETYLRDARRRGDLYAVASYANGACEAMTYQGRTAQARRLLDTTHWTPPEGDYHTANYSRLFLRIHADLFDGIPAEQTEAREAAEFKTLASALLMFVQLIRSESRWLRAKLAIAIAARQPHPQARLAQAEKLARQIDREGVPFTTTWALGLRAGIASVRRQPEQAADLLRKCISAARENQMRGIAAAAERALGRLIGGDEGAKLVATAEAWMESEDVTNPDGLTRVLLPGFCELQPPRLLSAGT